MADQYTLASYIDEHCTQEHDDVEVAKIVATWTNNPPVIRYCPFCGERCDI